MYFIGVCMLLVLILAFQYNSGKKGVKFTDLLVILFFNYAMLGTGYIGEKGVIQKVHEGFQTKDIHDILAAVLEFSSRLD